MPPERILITVKTYPTLSRKHGETVCTAGIREDGTWVGLYPVPFRRLGEMEQYRKFDWVELETRGGGFRATRVGIIIHPVCVNPTNQPAIFATTTFPPNSRIRI